MQPLVITPTLPATDGQVSGVNRRLSLFIDALSTFGGPVRLLRIVAEDFVKAWAGRQDELDRAESAFWNQDIQVALAPRRHRPDNFANHYLRGILSAGEQPEFYPYGGPAVAAAVDAELARTLGPVLMHRLPGAVALLQARRPPAHTFFDLDDTEHSKQLRYAIQPPVWPGKLAYATHVPALLHMEWRGARASRATFVCSDKDQRHLSRLGVPRVVSAPNALDLPGAAPPMAHEPTVLFLGMMEYGPNAEAAARLVQRIMPIIWRSVPGARALVAGRGSESLLTARVPHPQVEYLGFVPDLADLYARTRVVCCPITNGGGTRIKLIEAAGFGRAIVSTRVGIEGLAFRDGESFLQYDDDAGLAAACVQVLHDDALCRRLGEAARDTMSKLYERSAVVALIQRIMRDVGAGVRG